MGVLADEYIRLRPDVSGMPRELRTAGAKAGSNFASSFASSLKGMLKKSLVAVGVTAGALFAGAIKKGFARLSAIEEAEAKLRGLHHTTKSVEKIMVSALASVKGTAFGLDEAATVAASAVAAGIKPGKELTRVLTAIADGATIGGDSMAGMGAIFVEVAASNKLQGDTINQLNARGIPIMQFLAKVTGKSQEKVRELASKGKIDFATFMKAMEEVGGAAKKSGNTTQGAFKNMGAAFSRVGAAVLKEVFPMIREGINKITAWLDKITPVAKEVGEKIGGLLSGKIKPEDFIREMKPIFEDIGQQLADALFGKIELSTNVETFLESVKTAADEFLPPVKEEWKKIWEEAQKTGETIVEAVDTDIIPALGRLVDATTPASESVGDTMRLIRLGLKIVGWDTKRNAELIAFNLDHVATPAVDNLAKGYQWMRGNVIEAMTDIKENTRRRFDEIWADAEPFVTGITGFFAKLGTDVVAHVKTMWAGATTSFKENHAGLVADVQRFAVEIPAFFSRMKSSVVGWVQGMWRDASQSFKENHASILADVTRFFTSVKTTASTVMNSVATTIATVLGKIRNGFTTGVAAIGVAWNGIKDAAKKPVKFVIETVLNDGLLGAVRAISEFVGYEKGKTIKVGLPSGWASGTSQVLPGYTPGRDVHRFYSATGGVLDLSGGEGIARPELVRAVGRRQWDQANKAARNGRVDEGLHYLGGFAQGSSGIGAAEAYARSIGIRSIGTYAGHHPSAALARDFMTSNRSTGEKMANWLWANRKQIHLWYEIYWRRIRSMTREGAGWQPYTRSNPHTDHVHGSWYPAGLGGIAGALSAAGAGIAGVVDIGKYTGMIDDAMKKLDSIKDTPLGEMVAGIPGKLVGAVKDKIGSVAATMMSIVGGAFTAVTGGSNRAIGRKMMLQRWPASQWPPLNSLWTRESGWRTTARNPSSGAYGIPQSLPASKMASAGSDWRTNPATQIKWGLGYIADRYGDPAGAWAHSQRTGWYDQGGTLPPGLTMALNTTGRDELVVPMPRRGKPAEKARPSRPITIRLDLAEDLRYYVQGVIDDNDEFHATMGRLS